jgi:DNA-binding winged helix-turn-helix (wHTH) protein/tetratricopeptide (TPR) repeat protein
MARSHMALILFGEFESDLQTGELFKQGRKIPLEAKPFQLLATLLERPGQLVTRQDLRLKIWPPGTYVDFGRCVNIAVTKLRHALSDSSDNPRYIETLPKRGYRFIASVEKRGQNRQVLPGNRDDKPDRKIRVAFLPFETLCETQEHVHFGERLLDETISQIGSIYPEHVGVIARTSNLKYNSATKSVLQIGRDLKVDHVLAGSVRISAGRAHFTAELTATADRTISWSESYNCALGDVLKVRNEVALKIAKFLERKLLCAFSDETTENPTPNRDAHLEYLKGCHCHSGRTASAFWRSIGHFERAIHLDPNYAPSYSGLANVRSALGGAVFGAGRPKDFYQQAKDAALRALEINDRLSDCHTSLAIIKFFYEWDWDSAQRSLSRAIDLEPSSSFAHQIYSRLLSFLRRHEEAIEQAKRICELEPLSSQAHFLFGEVWYFARQYDKALEEFKSALELDEMHGPAMMGAANVCSQQSLHDEAISQIERANTLYPDNTTMLASLGANYARAGRLRDASRVLNKLKVISSGRYVSPFDFGLITAALGQKDEAMGFLQRAYQEYSPMLVQLLPEDPKFDALRDDNRFGELIGRVRANSGRLT